MVAVQISSGLLRMMDTKASSWWGRAGLEPATPSGDPEDPEEDGLIGQRVKDKDWRTLMRAGISPSECPAGFVCTHFAHVSRHVPLGAREFGSMDRPAGDEFPKRIARQRGGAVVSMSLR